MAFFTVFPMYSYTVENFVRYGIVSTSSIFFSLCTYVLKATPLRNKEENLFVFLCSFPLYGSPSSDLTFSQSRGGSMCRSPLFKHIRIRPKGDPDLSSSLHGQIMIEAAALV